MSCEGENDRIKGMTSYVDEGTVIMDSCTLTMVQPTMMHLCQLRVLVPYSLDLK